MVEVPEHDPAQEILKKRKAVVEQYLNELLPTEYPIGRAVSLWQNWYETVDDIVDFYQDESKGLSGKSIVRSGKEFEQAQASMERLTDAIQKRLGTDQFSDEQLSEWFGRVTSKQVQAIAEVIAESDLPVFSKSPKERFEEAVKKVMSEPRQVE